MLASPALRLGSACAFLIGIVSLCGSAGAQFVPGTGFSTAPGVHIDAEGHVFVRIDDATREMTGMRERARNAETNAKNPAMRYVSLPKVLAEAKALRDAGKEVPQDLLYLGGLTQIRYVFVYPEEQDLVIAGPCEEWVVQAPTHVTGKKTGRPVLHLDDVVCAMRTAKDFRGQTFGCGIWPNPKSLEISQDIVAQYAGKSRAARNEALAKALGPQTVTTFGMEADTRTAFICVAADYKLKRMFMGVDRSHVATLGNVLDNSRSSANKFWFETSYEPLRVSQDGNSFEIRGTRLKVDCGEFDFDPRGATDAAKAWTKRFNDSILPLCNAIPVYADLQNLADLSLLAHLIRIDRLDRKAGWDTSYLMSEEGWKLDRVPTPKTCQTLIHSGGGSLAAGGVTLTPAKNLEAKSREVDATNTLQSARTTASESRQRFDRGLGPVVEGK